MMKKLTISGCSIFILMMAGLANAQSVEVRRGNLYVDGTERSDVIEVSSNSRGDGYLVRINNRVIGGPTSNIDRIIVYGYGGSDRINLYTDEEGSVLEVNNSLEIYVFGGSGRDTIDTGDILPKSAFWWIVGGSQGDTMYQYLSGFRKGTPLSMVDFNSNEDTYRQIWTIPRF